MFTGAFIKTYLSTFDTILLEIKLFISYSHTCLTKSQLVMRKVLILLTGWITCAVNGHLWDTWACKSMTEMRHVHLYSSA